MDSDHQQTAGTSPGDRVDLVSIGETMVVFASYEDPRRFVANPAGAESNVAVGMARLGCRTRWVSRLGDDPLGDLIETTVGGAGVEVVVVRDPARPTGVMTKHVTAAGATARYYRGGSAASRLSTDDLQRVGTGGWIHVTGITPALSPSAADLVAAIVERRTGGEGRVSFDVNYRPALWPDAATAADALLGLASRADLVFVGDDEAEALFGSSDAEELAALMLRRPDQELVMKRGAAGAVLLTGSESVFETALPADLLDATGAGDAFAAGYLAASCFGWPARARLRLGHVMGARVVGVLDDVPPPFPAAELASLSPGSLAERWGSG